MRLILLPAASLPVQPPTIPGGPTGSTGRADREPARPESRRRRPASSTLPVPNPASAGAGQTGGFLDRAQAVALHRKLLADGPLALGVWSGREPNAFDGRDAEFVGAQAHDATGRYVPDWVRSGGQIVHEVLLDYAVHGAGDYHIKPFTSGRTAVIDPYVDPANGKDGLTTSVRDSTVPPVEASKLAAPRSRCPSRSLR